MTAPGPPDMDALRRASRYAGALTLGGVAIVLASVSYGVWRLSDTETELKSRNQELDAKRQEVVRQQKEVDRLSEGVGALEKSRAALDAKVSKLKKQEDELKEHVKKARADTEEFQTQLLVLRKEAGFIRAELKKKFANPKNDVELWAKPEYRAVMVSVLVTPSGQYRQLRADSSSPTGKWFRFTLRLVFPSDAALAAAMKGKIRSVTWDLNHPYRKMAPIKSGDAAKNYAVTFEGAGTLRNVIVRIALEGAGVVSLDYDMTKAFPELPEK